MREPNARTSNATEGASTASEPPHHEPEPNGEVAEPDVLAALQRVGRPISTAAIALAAVTAYFIYDIGVAILVLAGGVLLTLIAIFWVSVRTLAGDTALTVDQALDLATPSAAEEQKRAVLRALKDLEYERSVGKVSDADYKELLARYRAEAKRLLRAADQEMGPLRAKAEAFVTDHRRSQTPRNRKIEARPSGSVEANTAGRALARSGVCASCQTPNDADAIFCKKCGARLEAAQAERVASASGNDAHENERV